MKLKLLITLCSKILDDLKSGNCYMTDEDIDAAIDCLREISTSELSKYQACSYLNMSRAKFDNLIREGKLPKGKKKVGFTELFWSKYSLDKAIKDLKE